MEELENENQGFDINSEPDHTVYQFEKLISIIVDYYCFKNNISESEDGEEWKKKADIPSSGIIPDKIHNSIEKSFLVQLKKFS